jgi:hypothetical protein
MKINISIMCWINRVLMVPFVISLLIGIIDLEFLYYSTLIAFTVGVFQMFSFLLTAFYFKRIKNETRIFFLLYISSVFVYFLSFYLLLEFYSLFARIHFLRIVFWTLPVILSILWTYILESIKKEI